MKNLYKSLVIGMMVPLLLEGSLLAQRDPIKWPFSKTSIWNMPIHKDARYVPATLKYPKSGLTPDQDILILKPDSPLTKIYTNYAGWDDSKDRCIVQGPLLFSAPIPVGFTVSKDNWLPGMPNAGLAVLMPDGRTIKQTQPFARCTAGSDATSQYKFKDQDIYGDGYYGAHGGSGLSAIGGTLRLGELVPGGIIRHVMKINVCALLNLALNNDGTPGYRWPAANADSYAADRYRGENPAMEIGSLLAIPDSLNLDSMEFETEAGKILATAFQNYGAYIVDDSYLDVISMETEFSPDGRMIDEFKEKWGFDFGSNWDPKDTPWTRDFKRIIEVLHVVDNNTKTTIGGGQTNDFQNRLAPMAPDLDQIPTEITMTEAENRLTIFPTPTRDYLYINGEKRVKNYSILSLPGQILKQGNIDETHSIDVKCLAKGNYFIRLEGENFIQIEKIIKL
jgi:hypothetical protein